VGERSHDRDPGPTADRHLGEKHRRVDVSPRVTRGTPREVVTEQHAVSSEELGEALQVGRLLYVVENFFSDASGVWHELGLYFLLSAEAGSFLTHSLETFTRQDEVGNSLRFDWLPIAQLEAFPLYPPFFQTALKDLPEHPVHIEEHRSRSE